MIPNTARIGIKFSSIPPQKIQEYINNKYHNFKYSFNFIIIVNIMIGSKQTFYFDNNILYAAAQNYYMSRWNDASTATAMNADNLIDLGCLYDGRELSDGEHFIGKEDIDKVIEIIDQVFDQ
jgi:hypothetical protein